MEYEIMFKKLVDKKVKELTFNEDIEEFFFSFFSNKNYSKIPKKSILECVIIEPRIHKNLKNVLNNFTSLLPNASFTIYHSVLNLQYIQNIIGYSNNFNLVLLPDNFNRDTYSKLLTSVPFWKNLHGEKILIFQVDSGLRKNNILNFWNNLYIGAPWKKSINNNYVGNGGFSLRDRKEMINICENHSNNNLPEDVFFSKYLGKYTTVSDALAFSIEYPINENKISSMGYHQIIDKWERGLLIQFFSDFEKESKNIFKLKNVYLENNSNKLVLNWLKLGIGLSQINVNKNIKIPYINNFTGYLKINYSINEQNFSKRFLVQDCILQQDIIINFS